MTHLTLICNTCAFRWNGQKIFYMLMDDPKFEQYFIKAVPENTRNNIKDKLDNLRRKVSTIGSVSVAPNISTLLMFP